MTRWLKRLGIFAASLFVLVCLGAAGVYGFSEVRYRKTYDIPTARIAVAADSASLARGSHLAHALAGCADCHGEQLQGAKVVDDPALGRVYAPNLTSGKGGVGASLTNASIARAIRHGVGRDGRALKIMPSQDYVSLSDADVGAIISYVKSVAPQDHVTPPVSVGPLGRTLMLAGKLPILTAETLDHTRPSIASVTPSSTVGYGAYLASVGCKGCHGQNLAGGRIASGPPDWPPAANLTPAGPTKDWKEDDFRHLLREGKRPDGSPVSDVMPWRMAKNLTDDEIHALFLYIRSIPGAPTPAGS